MKSVEDITADIQDIITDSVFEKNRGVERMRLRRRIGEYLRTEVAYDYFVKVYASRIDHEEGHIQIRALFAGADVSFVAQGIA